MIQIILHGFLGTQRFSVWTWQQVFDSLERGDRIHVVAGPIVTIVRQA